MGCTVSPMLDHDPVTQAGEPALRPAHPDTRHVTGNERLRRQLSQQQTALTHLRRALLGLRCGAQALREENRELRRELSAARGTRSVLPAAGAAELFRTRPIGAHERHQAAVGRTLGWADEAAGRDDVHEALAWLKTLEAIGEILPDHYLRKQEEWTRRARANATAEAA